MSHDRQHRSSSEGEAGGGGGGSPGKRTLTGAVQRKAAPGAAPPASASAAGATASAGAAVDDPFAMHLQGTASRGAVQRKATEGSGHDDPKAAKGGKGHVGKLHLFIDVDTKHLGLKDLKEGNVGHAWVSLEYNDPAAVPDSIESSHRALLHNGGKYADPMGFWPAVNEGVHYSTNPLHSYVKGWVRHPDRAHEGSEKASETWDITEADARAVIAHADSKKNAQYSVFFYNCTNFAKELVQAAGKSAPSMSTAGICFPNAAYDGIKKRNEQGVGNTTVEDLDTGAQHTVHGPEAKK
ncbi:MAG TPA: hypothetical protein VHE35_12890 [Kofleriaceae bacterium]|nr:hypothetical protein [Kofleriaceae bacterium]